MSHSDGQAAGEVFDPTTARELPAHAVTRLWLLRHGEVEDFGERRVRGQLDAPLSARGLEQHAALVDWLAEGAVEPDVLLSSDLVRCRHLGEAVAARTGVALECAPELREQHMGVWQGRTWAEITAADPERVHAYWDNYQHTAPPEGESLLDLHARVQSWWGERAPGFADRRVVLATHVGVIRSFLCGFLGVDPAEALRFAPAVGSSTELLLSDAGAVLQTLGERPWRTGARRP